jgi:hypothetical protein
MVIVTAIVPAATVIGVALIGLVQYREKVLNEQRKHEIDRREDLRTEGYLIQLEMSQASLKLSKVTAKAVMYQRLNGDVEDAWEWVQAVEVKYDDYLRRITRTV